VYRGSVRGTCYIEFVRPTVAGVWLSIQPAQVLADGQSTVDVRAAVTLAGGTPAPDGTSVSFTSGAGVITSSASTTSGIAMATLTSSSQVLAQVPVIATAGALRDTAWVDFVPGSAASVLVTVNPDSLYADGTAVATVTAQARDVVGHPVADGTVI